MIFRLIVSVFFVFLLYPKSYGSNTKEILYSIDSPFTYHWLSNSQTESDIVQSRIKIPIGYSRKKTEANSFTAWLRHLPLKEEGTKVKLYNGQLKNRQDVHEAIVDIDIGKSDLQQCADAVIRLRAEYLYAQKKYDDISFNFTNGQSIPYKEWRSGKKITFKNNKAIWINSGKDQTGYQSFKKYNNLIFAYAGTYSLNKEMLPVPKIENLDAGDVFIQGGFPGHAVIVIDVVLNTNTGDKCFLLAQSYMPAQNIHILKNKYHSELSPWYSISDLKNDGRLITPEWTFELRDLKRFK